MTRKGGIGGTDRPRRRTRPNESMMIRHEAGERRLEDGECGMGMRVETGGPETKDIESAGSENVVNVGAEEITKKTRRYFL